MSIPLHAHESNQQLLFGDKKGPVISSNRLASLVSCWAIKKYNMMALRFVLGAACLLTSLARASMPANDSANETASSTGEVAEDTYAGKGSGDSMTPAPTSSFGAGLCEQSIELILSPVRIWIGAAVCCVRVFASRLLLVYEVVGRKT